MLIPSHTVLASHISEYISAKYGFHFVANAIYLGSVMPDLRDKEDGSHYSENCLINASSILDEINSLAAADTREFSYKVGVLLHFIADYFTNAHNKEYLQRNMRLHMLYEMRLHFQLSKALRSFKVKPGSELDALTQIKVWHNEYKYGKGSVEKDLRYILQASYYMADKVVAMYCSKKANLLLAA
ncbi:MAG: zinc dependent phospholipase C family protein [Bacillota bacterium]|nr:zinc dependent phospholipase C family protein [Bacillota bacterium]